MKFVSIFKIDHAMANADPTPELMAAMGALITELMQKGVLVDTGGTSPTQVSMRAHRHGGKFEVIDGPFTESKEVVGGFAVFDVSSKEEMLGYARRFLECAGSGTCEIFEVSETPKSEA